MVWDLGWYVDMVHLLDRQLFENLEKTSAGRIEQPLGVQTVKKID